MSDATKAAMEAAIQAHISDESAQDDLVTNYVLGCALTSFSDDNERNRHSYWFESIDNQPAHITRGMADLVTEWASGTTIYQEDDDDD